MKKKILIVLLVLTLVGAVALSAIACNDKQANKPDQTTPDDDTTVPIKPLPDMVDYGADSANWSVNAYTYATSKVSAWETKLLNKQKSELEDWVPVQGEDELTDEEYKAALPAAVQKWLADKTYLSFGPRAVAMSESKPRRQSNVGYFDVSGSWITDESANTIERIFCYSSPADVISLLAKARIDEDITADIVDYITREDDDRAKGTGYTMDKGTSSAIEDYDQLDELRNIYSDWNDYKNRTKEGYNGTYKDYATPGFASKDDVYDAMSLKERKIYGEIFDIFGDEVAQFARATIAMCGYAIKVLESDMIPEYEEAKSLSITGDKLTEYMREEVYDYDTLSYLLSYREYVELTAQYEATKDANHMGNAMSLYGYHYQYKHRDYQTFDDSVKVTYGGVRMTEYEHFLKLSHCNDNDYYFDVEDDALAYRDYDHRQYEKSYRYTYACYKKYYEKQLNFQALQEKYDRDIYMGGRNNNYKNGIGYWDRNAKSNEDTYTYQMQEGLEKGFESTLKISDVNWLYTVDNQNVLRYNYASKAWNSLSSDKQDVPKNKILKVNLELEQLKSQDFTLNHKSIKSPADLTNALKYQIKSYSADSIRGIQSNKKDEVIYYKDIQRFMNANGVTEADLEKTIGGPSIQVKNAYASLSEDAGRNYAKYINLKSNFSLGNVEDQMTAADKAKWDDNSQGLGIKGNVKATLDVKYSEYKGHDVDVYFEDTLIKKKYSCGAALDNPVCPNNNGGGHGGDCTKEYDTDWALSRLLDNHEVVLRYMYGQIEISFYKIKDADIKANDKFAGFSGNSQTAVKDKWYKITGYEVYKTTNILSNEAIATACRENYDEDDALQILYPESSNASEGWKYVPDYKSAQTSNFVVKSDGSMVATKTSGEYTYTFIGWYVDEAFLYPVRFDEEIDYDIRLYPCYKVVKK